MAQKPDKFPDWATEEEIDEVSGQANFVEPPDFRKESGWTRREIPPRQWFNWLARKTGLWFRWVEDRITGLENPNQSLTTNGYQVLPGGLILQWGIQAFSGAGTQNATVTFPIEFPNEILNASVSHAEDTGQNPDSVYHANRSVSSMTVGITGDTPTDVMWQVIGR